MDARNVFIELKKDYALLCAPITPLHEILQRKTVASLKKLAAMLPIKNYSSMRKAELIDIAEKMLLLEDRMEDALLFVNNDEWNFLVWMELGSRQCFKKNGMQIADEIHQRIKRELNITVTVGVSWNKTFAKLGSDGSRIDFGNVYLCLIAEF